MASQTTDSARYFSLHPAAVFVLYAADVICRLMSKVVEEKDVANPRIATLLRPRFDHIPPTLFIVAECDIIRDDSYGQQGVF